MVDFFDKFYSTKESLRLLHNLRFYSGLRLVIKLLANLMIPLFYLITNRFNRYDNIDSNSEIIISITSFPDRIDRLWVVIESILRQDQKVNKVILWLSKDQFSSQDQLPKSLISQTFRGLNIKFCDSDLKSHKKYFYVFKKYPKMTVITLDDDVIYGSSVISKLMYFHNIYPKSICCNIAHKIRIINNEIADYVQWESQKTANEPTLSLAFIGVGGVLYPPNVIHKSVFDREIFMKLCINQDDLWLKACSLLNKTKVCKTDYRSNFLPIIYLKNNKLSNTNVEGGENDLHLQKIRNYFNTNFNNDPFEYLLNGGK